ncbi:hypothetical protein KIN20_003884 [Parelaphostrongylus tenuis]|uniref:Uncharacterized protein n=1 Tax=Parelaphostrongylus tenuis TaxID=148309 RepID=A0AAD5QE09_PARTN|nr:hypothetical protein KIN20_003884 [Parelaphostrongylus tenuis]
MSMVFSYGRYSLDKVQCGELARQRSGSAWNGIQRQDSQHKKRSEREKPRIFHKLHDLNVSEVELRFLLITVLIAIET